MSIMKFVCGTSYINNWQRAIFWAWLPVISLLICQPETGAAQTALPNAPPHQEVIGRLAGDDVSVTGAIGYDTENGRTTALLASGSDLTLRSGQAKIDLPDGGDIIICGPAHLSVVKSGPAITIALEYGQVHLQVGRTAQITVYTALLVVTPEAIGDRGRDLTVGLDQNGQLCITSVFGAVRIEEQFSAEKVVVPQGGDIEINRGELNTLRSGSHKCSCELLVSQNNVSKQMVANAPALPPRSPIPAHRPDSTTTTTSRIDMPPLTFEARSAAHAPALSSEVITLISESVADPQPSFRGEIKPALPPPPAVTPHSASRSRASKLNFFARLFGIFHHHKSACDGPGCTAAVMRRNLLLR
jgi:hypothetical protein